MFWAGTKEKQREGVGFACVVSFLLLVGNLCLFLFNPPPLLVSMDETPHASFKVGDTVLVYQGTAQGTRGKNTTAFIGTVVGFDVEQQKWLVLGLVLFCLLYS